MILSTVYGGRGAMGWQRVRAPASRLRPLRPRPPRSHAVGDRAANARTRHTEKPHLLVRALADEPIEILVPAYSMPSRFV